jgi:hypothetical protein
MPHLWKAVSLGLARMLGMSLVKMKPSEVENLAQFYLRGRAQKQAFAMEIFAREIARPTQGAIYDSALNGENRLLERTRGLGRSIAASSRRRTLAKTCSFRSLHPSRRRRPAATSGNPRYSAQGGP